MTARNATRRAVRPSVSVSQSPAPGAINGNRRPRSPLPPSVNGRRRERAERNFKDGGGGGGVSLFECVRVIMMIESDAAAKYS